MDKKPYRDVDFRIKKEKPSVKKSLPPKGTTQLTVQEAYLLAMKRHQIALAYLKDH